MALTGVFTAAGGTGALARGEGAPGTLTARRYRQNRAVTGGGCRNSSTRPARPASRAHAPQQEHFMSWHRRNRLPRGPGLRGLSLGPEGHVPAGSSAWWGFLAAWLFYAASGPGGVQPAYGQAAAANPPGPEPPWQSRRRLRPLSRPEAVPGGLRSVRRPPARQRWNHQRRAERSSPRPPSRSASPTPPQAWTWSFIHWIRRAATPKAGASCPRRRWRRLLAHSLWHPRDGLSEHHVHHRPQLGGAWTHRSTT